MTLAIIKACTVHMVLAGHDDHGSRARGLASIGPENPGPLVFDPASGSLVCI